MENENLVITKDNYKGYVELYKKRFNMNCNLRKLAYRTLIPFAMLPLVIIITAVLKNGIIPIGLSVLETVVFVGAGSTNLIIFFNKKNDIENKNDKEVVEEYPYVNINVSDYELEDALIEAKILTYKYKNNVRYEYLDIEGYENYLKCEEEKEKYLEETKYDGYVVNPGVTQEELERVKEKVKKLVR